MKHLAIIADGNRRWATKNNLPTQIGHAQGLVCIERVCEWALKNDIAHITFYVFSTENWGRNQKEIDNLFELAKDYFSTASSWYVNRGICVQFSGRRDRLPNETILCMEQLEYATINGSDLHLTICADYGGRDEIARAVMAGARTEDEITQHVCGTTPLPDMIVRTGGHKRLSNFLLWQSAYAELMFIDTLFPDLEEEELNNIKEEFYSRQRNFGR